MTTRQVGYRLKTEGKEEVKRDLADVGRAGNASGQAMAEGFDSAGRSLQSLGGYSDAQMARYRKMAEAARDFQTAEEQQRKFNAILGVREGSPLAAKASDFLSADEVGGRPGMTRQQRAGRLNLLRQGADVFTTGAMGMDPMMIAIQQGPQILDALATSGFKASGSLIAVGSAVAGLAGGLAILTKAGLDAEAQFRKIDVAVNGLGRTSGMTADQLLAAVETGRQAGEISVKSAVDIGTAYVETGKIGSGVLGDLIGLTRDYAATTSQDAKKATAELAQEFSNGAKGVANLNDKLHFLDAAELKHIQNLYDAGDAGAAQRLTVDKLKDALIDASSATTGWANAFDKVKVSASNAWQAIGKAVALAFGGGSDAEKMRSLLDSRSAAVFRGFPTGSIDKDIAELQAKVQADAKKVLAAQSNSRSVDAQAIRDQYADPKNKMLQDQQNSRARYVSLGGKEGDATVKAIDAEIAALKAGYTSAADQAAKLEQAHRKAIAQGRRQVRDEAKDAREAAQEAEKLTRQKTAAVDHALDQERKLATIRGDASAIDLLSRQADLQQETNRYLAEGESLERARYKAIAQINAEMQAESDTLRKQRSNPEGFVSSADAMKGVGQNITLFSAKDQFIQNLGDKTAFALRDGLVAGMTEGNFFEVFTDRLKYAAAIGFAEGLSDALRNQNNGSGGGGWLKTLVSTGMSLFGGGNGADLTAAAKAMSATNAKLSAAGFANGTESAPEGWAWVGEEGPELRKIRAGDKIRTHQASLAMVRQATAQSQSAAAGGRGDFKVEVHNHGAPVKAKTTKTDEGVRVDLYEDVGRDIIDRAGRNGDLARASKKTPQTKKYG